MFKDKAEKSQYSIMGDYLICLIAITFLSVYYYGLRALIVVLLSVVVSYVTDFICVKLRGKKFNVKDISAVISALIFTLLLPASVPYSMVVISSLVMIIVGKQAFGGNENKIFSPAIVAFVFAALCFKDYIFIYPTPVAKGQLDLSSYVSGHLVNSFTQTFSTVSNPTFNWLDMLLGKIPGPMGATNVIVILICAAILISRKSISILAFLSTVGTLIAAAFFFPIQSGISHISSVIYEIFSGGMIFCAAFVASDFDYVPKKNLGKIIYGIMTAALTILFRRYAGAEIGIVFAVILLTPLRDYIDIFSRSVYRVFLSLSRNVKNLPGYFVRFITAVFTILFILVKKIIIFIGSTIGKIIIKIKGKNGEQNIMLDDIDKSDNESSIDDENDKEVR